MIEGIFIVYSILIGLLAWFIICDVVTLKGRLRIIDIVYKDYNNSDFTKRKAAYEAVSYNKHLWTKLTLGNIKKLYSYDFYEKDS